MYPNDTLNSGSRPVKVTKENPCPHCGKPDWCYSIGELSVCNRQSPPAEGWEATSKSDSSGNLYYAPIREKKSPRPAKTHYYEYPARDGSPLVRVKRVDDGNGNKKITQERWEGNRWVPGLGGIDRADIPVYHYQDVQKAIADDRLIAILEGEDCVDFAWSLGLAATCNIGGSGKWRSSDSKDVKAAKTIAISPDLDQPGVKHAELIYKDFPKAQWLYPYPDSPRWDNIPKSQGLDIKDWVQEKKLSLQDLLNSLTSHPRTREK